MFLLDQQSPIAEHNIDDYFCAKLAYLSDIFDKLNPLKMSMRVRNSSVFLVADKIEEFKKNISIWKRKVKDKGLDIFSLLRKVFESTRHVDFEQRILHLTQLLQKFDFSENSRP